jgi:DNA-binding NarL/FixJ family response regulator
VPGRLDGSGRRDRLRNVERALGRLEADVERALMDVSVLAYALDRDGFVVWQNHAHRRVMGDAHGSHFTKHVAPEDRRRATEAFMSKIVGKVRSTQYAVEVRAKAGPLQFEVNSVPLVRDEEVVGVLALVANPPLPIGSRRVRLTPRQRDVLRLLARGSTTEHISEELHIARETVRNHIRSMLRALGVHSWVEAIAAARAAGLLDD